MHERVFRVDASALNLRSQPSLSGGILTALPAGQAVARLDDLDHAGWWFVFADTPGDGLYVGYVYARYLKPIAAPGMADGAADAPSVPEDDEEDLDDAHPREPVEDPVAAPPAPPSRPVGDWIGGWNPAVPQARRHESPNASNRSGEGRIDRIVIHVTGTDSMQTVMDRFMRPNTASAHYVIEPDGKLHQFVSEDQRAWHAGIQPFIRTLYEADDGSWRHFKRYFGWAHRQGSYPADAVFLDAERNQLGEHELSRAALVIPPGGGEWPDYRWFDTAWGRRAKPVGYRPGNRNPNNASIGIEILSFGSTDRDPQQYTEAMYAALSDLVGDICERHSIPRQRDFVCGHEDVNPVERWGWDPGRGFEWDRILAPGGMA